MTYTSRPAIYDIRSLVIPQWLSPFWVRSIYRKWSNSDLSKTLPTYFKCLKKQKVGVICIICRFHRKDKWFNYMHSKFHITGRYVTVLSLLLGYLPVQNWWFLASEGSVIKAIVEDFMQTYQLKFHIKY